MNAEEALETIAALVAKNAPLTDWEREFIRSLERRGGGLSEKQGAVLETLKGKYLVERKEASPEERAANYWVLAQHGHTDLRGREMRRMKNRILNRRSGR